MSDLARLLVTGATGFLGRRVVAELHRRGYPAPVCFVRPTSDAARLPQPVELCTGDLADPASLTRGLRGVDGLLNIASLGFGHGPGIVSACEAIGPLRAVFVSTTAIFTRLPVSTRPVRLAAEEAIEASQLRYTILRPTMIYGGPDDRNISRLVRLLQRFRVAPVVGPGHALQQPVHVADVARAVVDAFECPSTVGRCYNIGGGTALTYNELVATIGQVLGRRVWCVHLPLGAGLVAARLGSALGLRRAVTAEQLLRLQEDKAFPCDAAHSDFGYSPQPFAAGVADMIAQFAAQRLAGAGVPGDMREAVTPGGGP